MKQWFRIMAAGAAVAMSSGVAHAVPMIVNGSFEDPAEAANSLTEITLTGIPGWTGNSIGGAAHEYIINGNVEDTYGRNFGTTPFGDQYLGLNAVYRRSFRSIESQSVQGFTVGQAYALTVYVANLDGASDGRVSIVASDGTDGTGTELNSILYQAPVEGPYGDGVIDFEPVTLSFTAASSAVTFSIGNQSFTGVMGIDNVSLAGTGAVPEPATWATLMLGFGLVGGGLRRRQARGERIAA